MTPDKMRRHSSAGTRGPLASTKPPCFFPEARLEHVGRSPGLLQRESGLPISLVCRKFPTEETVAHEALMPCDEADSCGYSPRF
jgi:hypothetical protein